MSLEEQYHPYPIFKTESLRAHWVDNTAAITLTCGLAVQGIHFSSIAEIYTSNIKVPP